MKNWFGPKRFAGAMVIALTAPCMAEDSIATSTETIVVSASALTGVWKMNWPESGFIALLHHDAYWGPLRDHFCRIEQARSDMKVRCIGMGDWTGTVTVEDGKIHIAWGTMLARLALDGIVQSATHFDGNFAIKLVGIEYDDPQIANGTKLTLSETLPDKAGKSALLGRVLDQMSKGPITEKVDAQSKNIWTAKPEELRPLGAVKSIIYLGEFTKLLDVKSDGSRQYEEPFSVYDVEFANGERLCGLRQDASGALQHFACI
ncbi:MAG: hypothetical protein WCA78_16385 [Rhizomicrobium sp.]